MMTWPDGNALHLQVDLNDLNPDFTIELLNNVLLGNNVLPPGVISVLQPVITSVVGLVGGVVDSANLPAVLTALNVATLNDIAIQTAVIASCTTSTIPVGNYAAVTVAYAGDHPDHLSPQQIEGCLLRQFTSVLCLSSDCLYACEMKMQCW